MHSQGSDKPRYVFLMSAADEAEASVVESRLRACEVPVLRRHNGAGGYLSLYMGMSSFGIDIYVPSHLHAEAIVVVAAAVDYEADAKAMSGQPDESLPDESLPDESLDAMDAQYRRRRRIRASIVLALCASGVFVVVVTSILNLLYSIVMWMYD